MTATAMGTAGASPAASIGDLTAITELLHKYLDSLYASDADRLGQVLHPSALYATVADGAVLTRTMAEYLPIVAGRESGATRGDRRSEQVRSITLLAPTLATAVVSVFMGGHDYVDALTLLRVEGRWQIAAKVFHSTPKEA